MEDTKQPVGVALLSVLYFILTLGLLWAVGFTGFNLFTDSGLQDVLQNSNLSPFHFHFLFVTLLFSLALCSAARIGFWKERLWGWYCATFLHMNALFGAAVTFFRLLREQFLRIQAGEALSPQFPIYIYLRMGFIGAVGLVIFVYLLKGNTRNYFGLPKQKLWKVLGIEAVICIAGIIFCKVIRIVLI